MQGAKQPIILIYSRPRKTVYYDSIIDASKATGISRGRLLRGLRDDYGEIPNTRPVICIDEALPSDDVSP